MRYKFYISCVLLALLLLANLDMVNAIESNSKLSVYQPNPHYFQGMDSKPLFFASGGQFNPITGTEEFFDRMALYKMNYVRIFSQARDPYRGSWPVTYARVPGSGETNFGFDKFDLTHFDQTYWDILKIQVEMAEDRGIYIHISIFNHINYKKTIGKPWHWDGAAWNIDNNVNRDLIGDIDRNNDGDAIDWNEFYDVEALEAASWTDLNGTSSSDTQAQQRFNLAVLQRSYVDKYLEETSGYGNVFYEIRNEGGDYPDSVRYWVHYIDSRVDNPITVTDIQEALEVPGIDAVAYHGSTVYGDQLSGIAPPANAYSYNKGLIADTDGSSDEVYGSADINRKGAWIAFTSGWLGWNNYDESTGNLDTFNFELYGYLRNFHNFISDHSIPFWEMAPHDELASSGRVLAAPSREFIIYLVSGGSIIVNISAASGTFFVEWYNPKDGTYYAERPVIGGGHERFTPPFTGDAVLHISTDTFPPRTTSVITPTPNEAGWNNVTQVVVTFFRTDNGTGISHTNYSKISETGPWTTVETSAATGPDAVNVTDIHEAFFNVTVLKEGTTEIWYYSVDNTSNIETTKNVTVKIDTTSPIITIYSPENKTFITKLIPLNFTANEPLDTCLVSVDSTPNQTNCKILSVLSREYAAREGTVAWWHFNGDAADTSGNNNHGTITGASFVDGKFGSALKFDGINEWVSVNDSDSFDTINKTITIEAWIKPVLTGNKSAIFYKESCFGFEITERGNVSFVLCDINASCQRFDSKGIVKNNTWNHVAATSDGITMMLYINGEQDPITNPAPAIIYTSNYSVSIGIWRYGESSFDYPFNGDIEELRILNRCLSEEQIKSDYALGEGSHSVTVYGHDTAGNWNSSTVYFNIVTVTPLFDTGSGKYPSISGLHNGTLKPNQTLTVYKMYTYPCPGTSGHSEYVRIHNESGTVAKGNWTGYEGDWHNISFDKPFILKANETYNYTIRTGSYPQIIHARAAKVTGGTITCEVFIDANGRICYDWVPAIKFFC